MKEYFCDYCGETFAASPVKRFEWERPEIICPRCGSYCCYEDTREERARSVRRLSEYENKTETK